MQTLRDIISPPTRTEGIVRRFDYPFDPDIVESQIPAILESKWKNISEFLQSKAQHAKYIRRKCLLFGKLISFALRHQQLLLKILKFSKELLFGISAQNLIRPELFKVFMKQLVEEPVAQIKVEMFKSITDLKEHLSLMIYKLPAAVRKQLWQILADTAEQLNKKEHFADLFCFAYFIGSRFEEYDSSDAFRFLVQVIEKGDHSILEPFINDQQEPFLTRAIGWHQKITYQSYLTRQKEDQRMFARSQRVTVLLQLLETLPIDSTTSIVSALCRLIENNDRESERLITSGVLARSIFLLLHPSREGKHEYVLQILSKTLCLSNQENRQLFLTEVIMQDVDRALYLLARNAKRFNTRLQARKVLALFLKQE